MTTLNELIKSASDNVLQYIAVDVKYTCAEDLKINVYALEYNSYDDMVPFCIEYQLLSSLPHAYLNFDTLIEICKGAPDYFKVSYITVNIQPGYPLAPKSKVEDFSVYDNKIEGDSQALFIMDDERVRLCSNGDDALLALFVAMLNVYYHIAGENKYMNLMSRLLVESMF